ncbi:MAG: FAD-binding oxidoreductase [Vicinamibacterales bacterium]
MATLDQDALLAESASRWGADAVRSSGPDDQIGGVPSRVVLAPSDEQALAEMLAWASRQQMALVPRGAGSTLKCGRPPARVDAVLSLRRLVAPIEHRPGDLTATVPAGASLDVVNRELRNERQWLPLDPPFAQSTIGGLIATNDSGPRRLQHGTPRDLILGIRVVLADGRQASAGGRVVKNVAGYDLSRMLCGSEGRLAVVTAATFKLTPTPAASRTVVAASRRADDLATMTAAIANAPLSPSAVELEAPAGRLLVRFESTERAVMHQSDAAANILARLGGVTDFCADGTEEDLWREHTARIWSREGAILKVSLLPTRIGSFLARLRMLAAREGAEHFVSGRATLGVLLIRWSGLGMEGRSIEMIRQEVHAAGGTATVLSFPQPLTISTDLWDDAGAVVHLAQAVKARLDPRAILSPGRGPGGS